MTLNEAKEILERFTELDTATDATGLFRAVALGIEALLRVKANKDMDIMGVLKLLPGETEE